MRYKKMRQRVATDNEVEHLRWIVSYADFITLLFSFFVVMYAVSSVYGGDYHVLADSLNEAFSTNQESASPKDFDENLNDDGMQEKLVDNLSDENRDPEEVQTVKARLPEIVERKRDDVLIRRMADSVEKAMSPWIEKGVIGVKSSPVWLQVEINAGALFSSGSAILSQQAAPILKELTNIIAPLPNAIHVEGFTDNVPIKTLLYPSNWELSAARAASIVRMLASYGVDPQRMAAVGYGKFKPVADNTTIEGRSRNRRIVLVVLSGNDTRNFLDIVSEPKQPSAGESLVRKNKEIPVPDQENSQESFE